MRCDVRVSVCVCERVCVSECSPCESKGVRLFCILALPPHSCFLSCAQADFIAAMWASVGGADSALPGREEREAWVRAREQEARDLANR